MRRLVVSVIAVAVLVLGMGACKAKPVTRVGAGIEFPAKAERTGVETIMLEGATWGTGRTAVVFAHSYPTSMDAWAPFARTISNRGFLALTFNFRGYGLSEGNRDPGAADLDLEAAVDKAKSLGAQRVLVVGASMGGTAALVVGARTALEGIVAVSAPVSFQGLDAEAVVKSLKAPVLFVAAERDPAAAADAARKLEALAPEPRDIEIVKGSAAHGTELLEGDDAARVANAIAQFLVDHRG